jgi:NAD(P)H-dependent flavin oxidoreductase YrpB (nitropropane dioxygenase family)
VPRTPLCDLLGIVHPILSVGFALPAGPELAAAVSNAGGLGVLGGTGQSAAVINDRVRRTRALTDRPFGLNVILDDKMNRATPAAATIAACLAEHVAVLVLFWGDPSPYVASARSAGTKVIVQVGSIAEARTAAAAGVDAVIAQGVESGGHVRGTVALSSLVPAVVDAVTPLPVLAAGGIADGRGLAGAIALGAQGVSMGTRFVASLECWSPQAYKDRIVAATAEDTVYSRDLFNIGWPDAPHRVLRNRTVREWEAAGQPPPGRRPGEGTTIGTTTRADGTSVDVVRYSAMMPTASFDGDIDLAPLWCGESAALVNDIKPAGDIVREIAREADAVLAAMAR